MPIFTNWSPHTASAQGRLAAEMGNPTAAAEQLLRSNALRVSEFVQDSEQGLLILTP